MLRILCAMVLLSSAVSATAQDDNAAAPADDILHPRLKLSTTLGEIVLELDADEAPCSVNNFVYYASSGYYDGTIFHRVMPALMIQGGGYLPDMEKKLDVRPGILNEWNNGLKNERGTIAMARLSGRPHSATSQFFINVEDNARLDQAQTDRAAYAVFGRVVDGLDIVDKIKAVRVGPHPKYDAGRSLVVPLEAVTIEGLTLVRPEMALPELASRLQAHLEALEQARIESILASAEQVSGNGRNKSDSGLRWVVLAEGEGPLPQPTDSVLVHYSGWLMDGSKFDSSVDRGKPSTFGLNTVMKGWIEGVGMMKVGEKRAFVISPDLAYGVKGFRGFVPPNATLHFEVELLAINP